MRRLAITLATGAAIAALSACGGSGEQSGGAFGGMGAATGAGGLGAGGLGVGGGPGAGGGIMVGTGGGTGGVPIDPGGECDGISQAAENRPAPIDIIMAIDSSGSMTFEAQEVQNNMNVFASAILNQGIDVHVVVISEAGPPNPFGGLSGVCIPPPLGSGACPNDSNPPQYFRVDTTVNSSDALIKILSEYPKYQHMLRQKALKYFAVVTDDESSMDDFTFIQSVGSLDPGWFDSWKFFGVFCLPGNSCVAFPPPCASDGNTYMSLVNQTGGLAGSLCQGQSDFGGVFSALAQTVISATELACEWDIPTPPPGQMFEKNKVNVRYTPGTGAQPQDILFVGTAADCGPDGGWYYDNDAAPTKVQVCPSNCTTMKSDFNGLVDVLFGCFTVTVPR